MFATEVPHNVCDVGVYGLRPQFLYIQNPETQEYIKNADDI